MRHVVGDVPLGGSPFPPIADYAFLSDCEVCALVAPSGNVEWMCLPRFDGPSVFGAMLDRDAGGFRLGAGGHRGARGPALPAGHDGPRDDVGHPHGLGHRARRAAHRALAPRRRALEHAPALADRQRRRPRAAAHDALRQRARRDAHGVRAARGLRAQVGHLGVRGAGLRQGGRTRRGRPRRADAEHGPAHRLRGRARPRAHHPARRRHRVRRAVVERPRRPGDLRRRLPPARVHRRLLARVAQPRRVPRPSVAHLPAAQRADAEGADLRADRGDDRRGHHLAARDPRGRAQLGLPLRVDPRLDLHALGPLHAGLRRGGQRLLLLHPRRRREDQRRAADHVRHRRRGDADRGDAAAPRRLRARPAGARGQRRVRAEAARRVGRPAGLDLPAHQVARRAGRVDVGDPLQAGRARDRRLARARPRDLGGARRAAALHLVEGHVLGGLRPRRTPGPPARGPRAQRPLAAGGRRRSTPTSASTASTSAGSSARTTTPRLSTPRAC